MEKLKGIAYFLVFQAVAIVLTIALKWGWDTYGLGIALLSVGVFILMAPGAYIFGTLLIMPIIFLWEKATEWKKVK